MNSAADVVGVPPASAEMDEQRRRGGRRAAGERGGFGEVRLATAHHHPERIGAGTFRKTQESVLAFSVHRVARDGVDALCQRTLFVVGRDGFKLLEGVVPELVIVVRRRKGRAEALRLECHAGRDFWPRFVCPLGPAAYEARLAERE